LGRGKIQAEFEDMNYNPIIAEVTRGGIVESQHRGAFVVLDRDKHVVAQAGDIDRENFPRSAIKAFQALALLEGGGAKAFNLSDAEIALCCSSHNGEADHVSTAHSILKKCSCGEQHLECGAHWPSGRHAANALLLSGAKPSAIHNNCSGKHAGMLATCMHEGYDPKNYVNAEHPLQRAIAKRMGEICDIDLAKSPMGIDGCSVPTWAYGLRNMALGFARLVEPGFAAGERIIVAARAHPHLIAGTERFDTKIMQAVPRLFIKVGAEGVFCGSIAHAGLGFALKCDDGAYRGAEVAISKVLSQLHVWTDDERAALENFTTERLTNWQKREVGAVSAALNVNSAMH
jgi:L-asparaginase II